MGVLLISFRVGWVGIFVFPIFGRIRSCILLASSRAGWVGINVFSIFFFSRCFVPFLRFYGSLDGRFCISVAFGFRLLVIR